MNFIAKTLPNVVATVFFVGYIPYAPGTFGTLAAFLPVYFLRPSPSVLALMIAAAAVIGTISAHLAETNLGERDSGKIVIDEFAGYLVSIAFLPLTSGYLLAAFFLFRFFDILKPPPIRELERVLHGGFGIMADDLLAGMFANVLLQIWRGI